MKLNDGFQLLATAPDGVARLRELILSLAVQGKLLCQDPCDEPASALLKRIAEEKLDSESVNRGKRKTTSSRSSQLTKSPLPPGWEWSSLAEIGVINPRNYADDDLPVSFVQMSSIPTALLDAHSVEERPWSTIKTGFTHFAEGDVGVAKITPCFENGKSTVFRNLSNGIGAGTTELHVVRPLGGILPDYVLIFLKTPEFLLNGEKVMTGSAGQKRLPRDYFENTPFPLPPRAEQARIVGKVHELMQLCDALESRSHLEAEQHARLSTTLFEALATSESAHALAESWAGVAAHFDLLLDRPEAVEALEQTILHLAVRGLLVPQESSDEPAAALLEQVSAARTRRGERKNGKEAGSKTKENDELPSSQKEGWETVTFPDLCVIGGGATPSKAKSAYWEGSIPWVSPKDMKIDLISDAQDHVSAVALEETRLPLVSTGSLLIVVRGMILAHSFPVALTQAEVTINQDMKSLTPIVPELGPYLALVCRGLKRDILSLVDRSTHGTCKLQSDKLFAFQFGLPPLAEQSRILARVDELRRLCADLRARLTNRQTCHAHFAAALVEQTAAAGPIEGDLALAA